MELKQLTERVMNYLEVENINEMSKKIFDKTIENNDIFYNDFLELFDILSEDLVQVSEVLSEDFMQKIFQYYLADRKEKMQDYTPLTLARFVGMLAGESNTVIDMCAGSGALTIQKWNLDKNQEFMLYEYDEKVIPLLLFNMAIRNIQCIVCQSDVLQQEIYNTYSVTRGQKYGIVKEEGNELHANF